MLQTLDRPTVVTAAPTASVNAASHTNPFNVLPKPAYQPGEWVKVEQLANDDIDRPRWVLLPAQICGAQWNPRFQEWEYSLYFPKAPCPWLNDGYYDPLTVADSAIYPLDYHLAA